MYTSFKSDLINNMDHMHISSTEPSSVMLTQTRFKSWKEKYKNKLKQKGITHKITISINFNTENFDASNATNQTKSPVELSYMCHWGLTGPPAVTLSN